MSTAPESPPTETAPRRAERWRRRLLGLAGLLLSVAVIGYLTRASYVHPWLIGQVEDYVRERWGADLVVAEFESDWFTSARLRGVELRADVPVAELGGLVSATLQELEVEFSALDLLRGEWPTRIRGAGLIAALDPRVAQLEPRAADAATTSTRRLPAIELERIELTVLLDGERAVIRNGAVALGPGDWSSTAAVLAGLTGQVELELGPQTLALAGVELDGSPRLELAAELAGGRLLLERARADWAGAHLTLDHGSVSLMPVVLDLDFALQVDDLTELGAALGPEPWAGALHGGVHASGTWPDLELTAALEGDAVLAANHPLGAVELGLQLVLPGLDPRAATGSLELRAGPLFANNTRLEQLVASVQLRSDSLLIAKATVLQPGNLLELEDLVLPRSSEFEVWLARGSGRFRAQLTDLPAALGNRPSASIPPHELILAGVLGDGRARIDSGTLTTPGGSLSIESGVLSLVPGDAPGGDVQAELTANLDFHDLAPVGAILDDPTWTGEVHGSLQASGRLPHVVAEVELTGSGVNIRGIPLGEIEVRGRLDREAFRAQSITIRSGDDELTCSGGVLFEGPTFEQLQLQAQVADTARYFPGSAAAAGAATVSIDLALDGPVEDLEGRVDLSLRGWSALDFAFGELELTARATSGRYDIEHLAAELPEGQLILTGRVQPPASTDESAWSITAASGSLIGEHVDLTLMQPARVTLEGDGTLRSASVNVAGLTGQLDASFERDATGIRVTASGDLSPSPVLLERYLPWGPRWSRAAGSVTYAPGQIAIEDLELEGTAWRLALRGHAPLDALGDDVFPEGPVELTAELTHRDAGRLLTANQAALAGSSVASPAASATASGAAPITARIEAALELSGTWRELRGGIDLNAPEIELIAADQRASFTSHARLESGQLHLERAVLEVPGRLALELDGSLSLATTPHPWLADPRAELERAELDLRGEFDLRDLSWLASLLPSLRRTGGAVHGQLELSGPLDDPLLVGGASLAGGELKLTSDLPAMSDLEVELQFEEHRVTIAHASGELGGSPFELGGSLTLATGATPAALDLRLVGENLLIYRDRDLLLRADADLKFAGALEQLACSGRLALRQPKYTQDVNLLDFDGGGSAPASGERGLQLFSITEPPLADMRFDVEIETVEPMLLRNNIVRGSLRPSLRLEGTGRVPRVIGTVYLDPTLVKLPASTVKINSGTIVFRPSDPFVPELEVFGTAVKFGHQITLLLTGPYDAPELTLSSSPPLAKEDLLMILLTGQFPDQASTLDGSRAATQTVALYLAEDLVSGWMGEGSIEDGQDSFFDNVEIALGREVTKSGVPTTEVFLQIAEQLGTERDRLKLAMELDIYDNYNLGLRFVLILR